MDMAILAQTFTLTIYLFDSDLIQAFFGLIATMITVKVGIILWSQIPTN